MAPARPRAGQPSRPSLNVLRHRPVCLPPLLTAQWATITAAKSFLSRWRRSSDVLQHVAGRAAAVTRSPTRSGCGTAPGELAPGAGKLFFPARRRGSAGLTAGADDAWLGNIGAEYFMSSGVGIGILDDQRPAVAGYSPPFSAAWCWSVSSWALIKPTFTGNARHPLASTGAAMNLFNSGLSPRARKSSANR